MTNLEHHSESYWQSLVTELRLSNSAQTASLMEYEKRLCDIARLANRVLLIGDEEGWFEWKGDEQNGGNHSSLHRDLTKVANSRVYKDFCDMHVNMIKSLEQQNKELQARIEELEGQKKDAWRKWVKIDAIDELFEEHKSCDGCKQNDCPMYLEAVNYSVIESKKDFYCSHYEPKQN